MVQPGATFSALFEKKKLGEESTTSTSGVLEGVAVYALHGGERFHGM